MKSKDSALTQKTIMKSFDFEGVGLHTGKVCKVRVSPLPTGSGIRFFRDDLDAEIIVSPESVTSTARGTTLSGEKNATIHTIEHFLATVSGFGIKNLKVEMNAEEMPILDGSAVRFCEMFQKAGVVDQHVSSSPIKVTEILEMQFGEVYLKAEPSDKLELDVTTSFPYPGLGNQRKIFKLESKNFEHDLAPARTFCLKRK